MPVVDLGDVQLFFTDTGAQPHHPASVPAIVLVHGWACDSHDWLYQHDALAAQHRVVALDLRGHGRSSAPASGYSTSQHARDLVGLLDHLGLDRVVVVGHSMGGAVAAALSVEHPDRVVAMVGVDPAYGQDETAMQFLRGATDQFGLEGGPELAAELVGATEPNTPDALKVWHRRRLLGIPPALLQATFEGLYFEDESFSGQPRSDPYLARRAVPTLSFHRFPEMAAWEQGLLSAPGGHPASRTVSWEGSGHWLHQTRPDELNDLVLTWIASLATPVASPVPAPLAADVVPA